MISLTGVRRMLIALTVRTAAVIVRITGGTLHFDDPQNSGLLGVL